MSGLRRCSGSLSSSKKLSLNAEAAIERIETRRTLVLWPRSRLCLNAEAAIERIETSQSNCFSGSIDGLNAEAAIERIETSVRASR